MPELNQNKKLLPTPRIINCYQATNIKIITIFKL